MFGKRLLLGAAAGALAVTGAQAADLPVAPEPIDYVRVCDAFGPGFYFIPGTDTCLRVAGRIRADYNYFDFNEEAVQLGAGAFGTSFRGTNAYRFRARAYIYMDSRTNTEFGLLRTFTEVYFTGDYGGGADREIEVPGVVDPEDIFVGDVGASESTVGLTLNRAFIQFGGLTFGRTQSFYDFLDAAYASAQFFNANYSDTTTNLIAYTFAFGNGFSASLSLEDEGYRRLQGVSLSPSASANPDAAVYAGNRYPDIVGNIRVDQGWGSAQIMAAGHNVETVQGLGPGNDSSYGFAVGAGINVNVPFGTGTSVGVQGGYTQGALRYVSDTPIGGAAVNPVGVLNGPYASLVSTAGDFLVQPDGSVELVDAWSVSGGFSTSITPTISFAFQAGYLSVDHADFAVVNNDVDGDGLADSGDFNNFDVEGFLGYSPVSGFVLGVGAQYKYVDLEDKTYTIGGAPGAPIVEVDDPQALSVFFRAQRTF